MPSQKEGRKETCNLLHMNIGNVQGYRYTYVHFILMEMF